MHLKNSWLKSIVYTVLALVLCNVLHAVFLYQKQYEPIQLDLTVTANYNTSFWTSVESNYQNAREEKTRVVLKKGMPEKVSITLDYPEGIRFLSFYWSRSELGELSISDVTLESVENRWEIKQIDKFIAYASSNVVTKNQGNTIRATSKEKGNGWLMVESELVASISKTKHFLPFGWVANGVLFVILSVLFLSGFNSHIKRYLIIPEQQSTWFSIIRYYVLSLWLFLLPFWLQGSHVLLAVSLALVLIEGFHQRRRIAIKEWIVFAPLLLLFVFITAINSIFHQSDLGTNIVDYSYFLVAPIVFFGLSKIQLVSIFKHFQIGVLLYVLLLIVAVFERFYQFSIPYSLTNFFFETTELYWHTSYLATLIIIAILGRYSLQQKLIVLDIAIFITLFTILWIIQARLPLLVGILVCCVVLLRKIPKKRKRIYLVFMGSIFVSLITVMSLSSNYRQNFQQYYLTTDTQKSDARFELWSASLASINEHISFGVGSSQVRDAISEKLSLNSDIKNRRYNAHNQYIEFFVAYGFIIPVLLLLIVLFPIILKYRTTTFFIMYFSVVMMVESYFSRQAGVVTFTLFYCFFIHYDAKSKQHLTAISH